jgi:hypothetical protein
MWTCQTCSAMNVDYLNDCGKCRSHRTIGDGVLPCDTCGSHATTTRTVNSLGHLVTIYYCVLCANAFDLRRERKRELAVIS